MIVRSQVLGDLPIAGGSTVPLPALAVAESATLLDRGVSKQKKKHRAANQVAVSDYRNFGTIFFTRNLFVKI